MPAESCSVWSRWFFCSTLVSDSYADKSATDATDTPGATSALGND